MSQAKPKTVAMLTGDLLFASKVKSAAQAADWDFYMGGNLPASGGDEIKIVVLDLSTRGGLTTKIVELCQAKCPEARLIAYGPTRSCGQTESGTRSRHRHCSNERSIRCGGFRDCSRSRFL